MTEQPSDTDDGVHGGEQSVHADAQQYKLHVYGYGGKVEETTDYFDTLTEAVDAAEMKCTDDTDPWQFRSGSAVLIDHNRGTTTADWRRS